MNIKRILGLILLIGGIGMVFVAQYISSQVEQGKEEIASAQKKVNQANSLFSLSPTTKELGKGFSDSAQKKIAAGTQEAKEYELLASRLQIGGIVFAVLGIGLIILGGKKKK